MATAVGRHPSRFVGFFMFNPAAARSRRGCRAPSASSSLRGICLFPAMHGYKLDDERVERSLRRRRAHGAAVFVHCGVLTVGIRKKLGLPSPFDLRLGDPLALAAVPARFPQRPRHRPAFRRRHAA